jgi:hypothetical protein
MRFMLLVEDLLLLLTDDETGKLAAPSTEVDVALGGALLVGTKYRKITLHSYWRTFKNPRKMKKQM